MSELAASLRERLQMNPGDVESFESLERELVKEQDMEALTALYRSSADALSSQVANWWMRLLRHLDQACSREQDPPKRALLYQTIGAIYEEELQRPDQAISSYQQAYRVSPELTSALDRARAIYGGNGNWDMVLRLWDLQLRSTRDAQAQADVHVAMGRVCLDHIGDGARATDYARRAQAVSPGHMGAQAILDDYADLMRDWRGEVALMVADARACTTPEEQQEGLLAALHFVTDRVPLGQVEGGPIIDELAGLNPHDRRVWASAIRWYDRASDGRAAEEAQRRLVILLQGEERVEALREAARRAYELDLRGHEIAARRGLLLDAPDDAANFERLEMLASGADDHELLFQIYEDAIAVRDSADASLLRKAAHLAADTLGDAERAAPHFEALLLAAPDATDALQFLVTRYQAQAHYAAFVDVAERLAAQSSVQDAVALYADVARTVTSHLGDDGRAIAAWEQVLKRDNDALEARHALRTLYASTHAHASLAALLEQELARPSDARIASADALHEALAELYAGPLASSEKALHHASLWVAVEPSDLRAGERLRALARLAGQKGRIRKDLMARIPHADGAVRAALVDELARLELEEGQILAARPWLDERMRAADVEVDLIRARLAIAKNDRDVDAQLALQAMIAARSDSDEEAVEAWLAHAAIAEDAERFDVALASFERVLAIAGTGHGGARAGALRALRALKQWEGLATMLDVELQHAPSPDTHEALALVAERELGDRERAADHRHRALLLDADYEPAARGLFVWHARQGAWDALEAVGATTGRLDAAWRAMHEAWAARVAANDVGAPLSDELEAVYLQLRRLASPLEDAAERQLRVAHLRATQRDHADAWIDAADAAKAAGDVRCEFACVTRAATRTNEGEVAAERWTRAAVLAESHDALGVCGWEERAAAWTALPNDRALRTELAKSSIQEGRIEDYAVLLDGHLALVDDAIRAECLRELGRLYGGPLDDDAKAIAYWAQLLTLRPDDEETLLALHGLYAAETHADARLAVVDGLLRTAPESVDLFALRVERATLLDTHLSATDAALDAWRVIYAEADEDAPARVTAAARIEALLRRQEAWDELDAFFSQQLATASTTTSAAEALVARAHLRLAHLDRERCGLDDFLNVLASFSDEPQADEADRVLRAYVVGEHADVLVGLMQWHTSLGREDVAIALLEERVEAHGPNEPGRWRQLIESLKEHRAYQASTIRHWIGFQFAHAGERDEAREMMRWSRQAEASSALVAAWSDRLRDVAVVPAWWPDYLHLAVETGADTDNVLTILRRLRGMDGAPAEAINDAIEELLASVSRYDEHIAMLLERAEGAAPGLAAERFEHAAQLAHFELNDYSRAADLYHKAWRLDPANERLIPAIVETLFAAERWGDGVTTLREALDQYPESANTAQWRAQLARASSEAGEPDDTVFEELRLAATLMPSAPAVGDGLEHLAFHEGVQPEVARSAASLYLSLGVRDPALRLALHERIVALTADDERRHASLLSLAELLRERDEHHTRAWDVLAEALTLQPGRTATANGLERLAAFTDSWRETAVHFATVGAAIGGADGIALLDRAVRIEAETLEDVGRAAAHLETLLQFEAPSDARLATLQSWYDALAQHAAVVEVLDRRAACAERAGDAAHHAAMRVAAAEAVEARLTDIDEAIARWRAIADTSTNDRAHALEQLTRLYEGAAEWEALDAVLEERIADAPHRDIAHPLLRTQARLREDQLRDPARAIASWSTIVREDLEGTDALDELDRLYLATGANVERYAVIQERFGRSGDVHDRLKLARAGLLVDDERDNALTSLASLVTSQSEVRADALSTLVEVADREPESLPLSLWMVLAQVLEDEGDLPGAARANVAVASKVEDPAMRRLRLWVSVSQRLESFDALEEAAATAIALWEEEGGPTDRVELAMEAARRAGAFHAFSLAAERRIDAADEPWLRRILAQWYALDDVQPDARRRHLLALYLAKPTDAELYHELIALTPEAEKVAIWRARMDATTDEAERQALRAHLGLALAQSSESADREEAQRLLESYRMAHSADERVNRTLRQLLADSHQWWQLASLIEEELWLTDDSASRVRLLVERARCREKDMALPSMLVEGWFDVLAEDPADDEAIHALSQLADELDDTILVARVHDRLEMSYERASRWRDLFELLMRRSDGAERAERVEALQRASDIAVQHLRDEELAYATLCQYIALEPADQARMDAAGRLAEVVQDSEPLRLAIEDGLRTPGLEPQRRQALRRRAALLRATQPGMKDDAIQELSALFDAHKDPVIIDDVGGLYAGDAVAFAAWLEARADKVDELPVRIRLLHRAAETLRALPGEQERAGSVYEAIFALEPSLEGAETVDRIYRDANLHSPRVSFWSARLQDPIPVIPLTTTHRRLQETLVADHALWAEQIKHLNGWWDAVEALRDAWGQESAVPAEEAAFVQALDATIDAWCATNDRSEREGDMLDALMRRVGTTSKTHTLFMARVAVASSEERADRLWEELVKQRGATISLTAAWETAVEALRDAPARDPRGASVEALAAELNNYEEAAALLRHVANGAFEERIELAVRAARIDIHQLSLLERATNTLQRVLETRPDHSVARTLLRDVLNAATRPELRRRTLETLIATARESAEKASLAMIATRVAHERGDYRDALAGAQRALEFDPGHAGVRAFLLDRRDDPRWRAMLERDLLPVLRAENAGSERRQLVEALMESETNSERKAAFAAELAQLLQSGDASGEGALQAWLDALRAHPHSPSYLEAAVRAVHTKRDAQTLCQTLVDVIDASSAPEVIAALYAAMGRVQLEVLEDPIAGEGNLLRSIQNNPRNENALTGLESFYLASENYDGLATLLQARLAATEDIEQKRQLSDRVVTLLRGELNRPADAAAVLEELVALVGQDESLIESLRASYREAGDIAGEVRTVERLAASATDADERIDLRSEALALARTHDRLKARALQIAEAILLDDAEHPEALVVREEALSAQENRMEALEAQLAVLAFHDDDDVVAQVAARTFDPARPPTKEETRLVSRAALLLLERDALQDEHLAVLADWGGGLLPADLRTVVQHVVRQNQSPSRIPFLVASLRQLRPSSDERLGGEVADAILEQSEHEADVHRALAIWFETAGALPEAIGQWQRVLDETTDDEARGELYLRIAGLEERRENFDVLMPLYEQARAHGNHSAQLYESLARGYERQQRWHELIATLDARVAVADDEESVRLLRRMAAVQRERLGDYVGARVTLERALASSSDISASIDHLDVLVALGDVAAAGPRIVALTQLDLRRELRHRVELAAGMLALHNGQWDDARGWLENARAHAASHARTLLHLAHAYIGLQQWYEAQESLQAALVNQDQLSVEEKATTFVLLARVQSQEGSIERARELVTRALRVSPGLQRALDLQAELDALEQDRG